MQITPLKYGNTEPERENIRCGSDWGLGMTYMFPPGSIPDVIAQHVWAVGEGIVLGLALFLLAAAGAVPVAYLAAVIL